MSELNPQCRDQLGFDDLIIDNVFLLLSIQPPIKIDTSAASTAPDQASASSPNLPSPLLVHRMNLIIPPTLDPITESPQPTPLSEETASTTTTTSTKGKELRDIMMAGTTATGSNTAGTGLNTVTSTESFDVNGAYIRALNDEQVSHRPGVHRL